MSKEAMKLALARLQARTDTADLDAIAALNEALAEQPAQQEPVALAISGALVKSELPENYTGHLYTSPPAQRTWVGLTDEEKTEIRRKTYALPLLLMEAIEAKLKEKNT